MEEPRVTRLGLSREILRLAVPAALQNLLHTAMFAVDTKMVSQYAQHEFGPGAESSAPLAAMAITSPVVWSLTVIATVTTVGTTALVGRRVGERNSDEARRITSTAHILSLLVGVAVALLGLVLCSPLVGFLGHFVEDGASEVLRRGAIGYLWWFFLFFPFRSGALTLEAAFRGAGEAAIPLYGAILANVVNIGANAIFIFGLLGAPSMGVEGAGLGLALASVAEFLFLYLCLIRSWSPRLALPAGERWRYSARWSSDLVRISFPALLEAVIFHSGFMVYQCAIYGLTQSAIAAHRIAIAIQSLAFMPAWGFHLSAASLSGRILGGGDPELATLAARRNVLLGWLVMLPVVLLFLLAAPQLSQFFSGNHSEWSTAALCLRIGVLEIPFLVATYALSGTLRGAGETREPVVVSAFGTWLVRVPLSWFFARTLGLGLVGIWYSTVLDWIVRAGILWWFFQRGRWRQRQI